MFSKASLALSVLPLLAPAALALNEREISNGPVMPNNFPDPAVISVGSSYIAYGTNDGTHNVPMANSNNYESWTYANRDALPKVGAWSTGANVWAPDVIQLVSPNNSWALLLKLTRVSSLLADT